MHKCKCKCKFGFISVSMLNFKHYNVCKIDKKKQRLVNKGTCVVKTNKTTFFHDLGPVCLKYQLLKERFLFIYLNVLLSSSLTTPT